MRCPITSKAGNATVCNCCGPAAGREANPLEIHIASPADELAHADELAEEESQSCWECERGKILRFPCGGDYVDCPPANWKRASCAAKLLNTVQNPFRPSTTHAIVAA